MADIYDNYNEIEFLESEIVEDDDSAPVGTLITNVDGLAKPVESEPAQEAAEAEPTEEETVAEEATAPETVTEEEPAVAETPVAEAAAPERDAEPISVETEETPLPTEEKQETPAAEESAPESAEVKPEVETNEAEKEPQTAAPVSVQSEDDKPAPAKKKTSKATTKSATEDAAAKPKAKPKKAAETVFQSAADDGNVWGNAVINTPKSKPKKENAALSQEEAKQEENTVATPKTEEKKKAAPAKASASKSAPKKSEEPKAAKPANKKAEVAEQVIEEGDASAPHGKFVIKKTEKGNFVYKLYSSNYRVVAIGAEQYSSMTTCKAGINSVRNNAENAPVEDQTLQKWEEKKCPKWQIYTDKKGEIRLRLIASNGNIVATTNDGYLSKEAAKKGIAAVARACKGSSVVRNDNLW